MLKNYLLVAWRNLAKNKTFSIINILGLALGLTTALFIIFHVKQELNYDKSFTNSDRIFRVTQQGLGSDPRHWAATSFGMSPTMQQQLPGIESSARFYRPYPYLLFSYGLSNGEVKRFEEKAGYFADSTVIDMFDISLVRGSKQSALNGLNSIIITEKMAERYFGNVDPLGKTMMDDIQKIPFTVTGVMKAMPQTSHLKYDYLISMSSIKQYQDQQSLDRRTWNGFYSYVMLEKKSTRAQVEASLAAFTKNYFEKPGSPNTELAPSRALHLQPITDIHLHSKLEKEMSANSDIKYVYIFSIAALFLLLVASVNFVNMSTAQAFQRLKEIGMRKVVGASRGQLIRQFFGESMLTVTIAAIISIALFGLIMPFYSQLTGYQMESSNLITPTNIALVLLLILGIGFLSGAYPAWFISRINAITSLKAKKSAPGSSVNLVRKSLIVFQFAVAVFIILSTMIVYRQMNLFHNQNIGFDKEQVVAVTVYPEMWQKFGALSGEISKHKSISSWSVTSTLPGDRFSMHDFAPLAGSDEDLDFSSRVLFGDEALLPTLNIALKEGRNFAQQFPDIKQNEFLVNEKVVEQMGLKNLVGTTMVLDRDTGTVVGVVRDFNFASLHASVEPLVIQYQPYRGNYLLAKVAPGKLPETLKLLEADIKAVAPASVFTYTFLDEKLNMLYSSEQKMSTVFKIFAGLSILISCLGLFALSAYTVQLRFKELGVRKVLGASVSSIVLLLSKEFIVLIILSILIALPIGYWVMNQWLEDFAYRTNMQASVFILCSLFALLMGTLTVGAQALKAALIKPIKSLRSE